MTRLKTISSYITDGELVIDVGCDMAILSIILAKRNIPSIASDLRDNIINNAKEKINKKYSKYIEFRVGDGITLKENEKNYTVVISGMGTHRILNIIKKCKIKLNKIITISNNNHDILRLEMQKLGYSIDKEEIIKEKKKYYNLIIFKNGNTTYTKEEILLGKNHQNLELLKEKNKYLINKYKKVLMKIKDEKRKEELENTIKILENNS